MMVALKEIMWAVQLADLMASMLDGQTDVLKVNETV